MSHELTKEELEKFGYVNNEENSSIFIKYMNHLLLDRYNKGIIKGYGDIHKKLISNPKDNEIKKAYNNGYNKGKEEERRMNYISVHGSDDDYLITNQ